MINKIFASACLVLSFAGEPSAFAQSGSTQPGGMQMNGSQMGSMRNQSSGSQKPNLGGSERQARSKRCRRMHKQMQAAGTMSASSHANCQS